MMKQLLVVCFGAASLAFAGASSHSITLFQPSYLNGSELKAGEYRMQVQDGKVTIKQGKKAVDANVKVETGGEKFRSTVVRYANENGKFRIEEIRIGGTNTTLKMNQPGSAAAGN